MLNFIATAEYVIPLGSQREFQSGERRQAWKIFPGLDALDISRADANLFRQLLLRQVPPLSEQRDVFTESSPVKISLGLAHRHHSMLAEMSAPKHEALPRAKDFSDLFLDSGVGTD